MTEPTITPERAQFEGTLGEWGNALCETHHDGSAARLGAGYIAVLAIFDRIVQERDTAVAEVRMLREDCPMCGDKNPCECGGQAQLENERDRERWQHASCLSIAEGRPDWDATDARNDSAAMVAVRALRAERDAAVLRERRFYAADGSFTEMEPHEVVQKRIACAVELDSLRAEVATLTAERKQIQFDVQPLQDIVPATAWGQNVCAWAAEHIGALTADNERLRAAANDAERAFASYYADESGSAVGPDGATFDALRETMLALRAALAPRETEGTP